jgi:NAD(P)H-hydrate epimerase
MQFVTASGRPLPAVDTDGMREVDRVAVEEVGLELRQMMENAGRTLAATAREVRSLADDADPGTVVVLAGGGGNGGGGICAARHLANHGDVVRLLLDRDPDDLAGAAAAQLGILREADVPIEGDGEADDALADAAVVVDALVGYGLSGVVEGRTAYLLSAANRVDVGVVSLDVPTGVDATTGEAAGPAVVPDRTLTLALPKTGLATADAGEVHLADVGIPAGVYERVGVDYRQPFDGRRSVRLAVDRE